MSGDEMQCASVFEKYWPIKINTICSCNMTIKEEFRWWMDVKQRFMYVVESKKMKKHIKWENCGRDERKIWPDFYILFKHFSHFYLHKPLIFFSFCKCSALNKHDACLCVCVCSVVCTECMAWKPWVQKEEDASCAYFPRQVIKEYGLNHRKEDKHQDTEGMREIKFHKVCLTISGKQTMLQRIWASYCVQSILFCRFVIRMNSSIQPQAIFFHHINPVICVCVAHCALEAFGKRFFLLRLSHILIN